jgi:hypothetical protein
MADRERKRAQRQKRKRRSAERESGAPESTTESTAPAVEASENGFSALSRSELRDLEAREGLEPLREDERPGIVTVGAVLTALAALLSLLGYALWDVLRDDARPPAGGVLVFVVLFGVMSWGMWKARYWAVLGFQTVLVFVLILSSLALIQATTILEAAGNIVLIAGAGYLFFKMVKALARIQMPDRLPRE